MPRRPLLEAICDPGFTPGVRDLDGLIDLLADDDAQKNAERALVRLEAQAAARLATRFAASKPPLRARIVRALGRLAELDAAQGAIREALVDADPKTRRNAAIALGHAHAPGAEDALLAAWKDDTRPEMHRSIAASLGKVGSAASLALLAEASRSDDVELARIARRATLMVERTASRGERGRIDTRRAPPSATLLVVLARSGLEDVLREELSHVGAVTDVRDGGPGRVRARLVGSIEALFAARTMLAFHFPLPTEAIRDGETEPAAIARVITSDAARAVFDAFTVGSVRYRIAWAQGGHRRALTWELAAAVAQQRPELVNDPTESLWEILVETNGRAVDVSLVPRAVEDPRFPWRKRDVPAASHPTVAAALARLAGQRPDDVVWDPFVGSGAELVERALLGPYRALHGSDREDGALAASRENLAAAGLQADLVRGDALDLAPAGVTLILTNPPMGRRAARTPGLADLLDQFVAHAASVLVPGGRLVWIAPWPARARTAGVRAGLDLEWARVVDVGGFDAEVQRWSRR